MNTRHLLSVAALALLMVGMPTIASSQTAAPSGPSASASASYDAQLQAIRTALLQAAAGAPTRVLSTAWVDDKGALREAAHYQSEAHVRGVRVLNYLRDENAPPEVSAEVLPWSLRAAQNTRQKCEAPPKPWRLPLQLRLSRTDGFNGPQQFVSSALLDGANAILLEKMQHSSRWRALEPRDFPKRSYERALYGPSEEYRGWIADLRLHPHDAAAPMTVADNVLDLRRQASTWNWTLTLNLRHTDPAIDSPRLPALQARVPVSITEATIAHPTLWWHAVQAQLHGVMQVWMEALDSHLRCEPTQFAVDRTNATTVVLRAGRGTGLRPGDRVLIMDRNQVPSHLLETGASAPLMLAEISRVGALTSELRLLAGPPLGPQGDWVALPW